MPESPETLPDTGARARTRRARFAVLALLVLTLGVGASCSPGGLIEFTVTANNDLTAMSFLTANNGGALSADVPAMINGTIVMATVPFGTDVTALVATFTTDGGIVTVGGTAQTSGHTANDFSHPVTYTVTAGDATTKMYSVGVMVAPPSAKDITAFAFLANGNDGSFTADVFATITGNNITATMPFGTNVTHLIPTFATDSAMVSVGGVPQFSGVGQQDFTNPVVYMVTAADNSTRSYLVTVTVASSSAKHLSAFAFFTVDNTALVSNIIAAVDEPGHTITATVPFATDVTALVAAFMTDGMSVTVGGTLQHTEGNSNNFANSVASPVIYTVHAADGSTQDYAVTVQIAAPSSADDMISFQFMMADNLGVLATDITAFVDDIGVPHTITATVPFGTVTTNLVAAFTESPTASVTATVGSPPMQVLQFTDTTGNDFSNSVVSPVIYEVHAQDGSEQDYGVIVTIAPDPSAKDLSAFAFTAGDNVGVLATTVTAAIDDIDVPHTITATVPFRTAVTGLVASFTTSTGATVTAAIGAPPAPVAQTSDDLAHPNDFSQPVVYTVHALDGSTQDYIVTVTVAPDPSAKDMIAFAFPAGDNFGALSISVPAAIDNIDVPHTITATVPYGTLVNELVASFTTSTGATVTAAIGAPPAPVAQTTDDPANRNDFSQPVIYTVHALDGSTQDYIVTITLGPDPAPRDITSFAFLAADNLGVLSADVIATVDNIAVPHTITAIVPFGTTVTGLVASFITTGATVSAVVGTPPVPVTQISDNAGNVNDYTNLIVYTVHATTGSTEDYDVIVTLAPPAVGLVTSALEAHYDAQNAASITADAAHNVSTWADLSGNSNDLKVNAIAPTYSASLINGFPGVDFTNQAGLVTLATPAVAANVTAFFVVTWYPGAQPSIWGNLGFHADRDNGWSMEQNAVSGFSNTIHWQTANDNGSCDLTLTQGGSYILVGTMSNAGGTATRTFTAIPFATPSSPQTGTCGSVASSYSTLTGPIYLGRSDTGEYSNAYFGEFLYYNAVLTSTEVAQNVAYLEARWGVGGPIIAGAFNTDAVTLDGVPDPTQGFDGGGTAYSATALGQPAAWTSGVVGLAGGVQFDLAFPTSSDLPNAVQCEGQTIGLPPARYTTLSLLAADAGVSSSGQTGTFTVNYTDGTSTSATQPVSDVLTNSGYPGESVVATMSYRNSATGSPIGGAIFLYAYTITLDLTKTVASITLPNVGAGNGINVLAIALTAPPNCAQLLAANPGLPSGTYPIAPGGNPITAYCDMTDLGGGWTEILDDDVTLGFPSKAQWAGPFNITMPNSGAYSIVNLLDAIHSGTDYEFFNSYPLLPAYETWTQVENPTTLTETNPTLVGTVSESPTGQVTQCGAQGFAGLYLSTAPTFFSGDPSDSCYWFAVGGTDAFNGNNVPAYVPVTDTSQFIATPRVTLFVR